MIKIVHCRDCWKRLQNSPLTKVDRQAGQQFEPEYETADKLEFANRRKHPEVSPTHLHLMGRRVVQLGVKVEEGWLGDAILVQATGISAVDGQAQQVCTQPYDRHSANMAVIFVIPFAL